MVGFIAKMFGKKKIETIESFANDIAMVSMSCGVHFVKNMEELGIKETDADAGSAANEYLFFFLHYVSRLVFSVGGVAAQKRICNDVFRYASDKMLENVPEKIRKECSSMVIKSMNDAEVEYKKCKLTASENEGLGGTLFFEASKRISSAAGGGLDIANLMGAGGFLKVGLSELKLDDRVKNLVIASAHS